MSQEIHSAIIRKPWQSWAFIGAFGALLMAFGINNVLAWLDDGFKNTVKTGWIGFAEGKPMQALAEDLRATPLADWLGQRQREIGWLVLHDTGPRVHQGCSGWLFLHDELQAIPNAEDNLARRAEIAIDLHRHLAKRGTRVLIALVPDKSRIEEDRLCGLRRPKRIQPRYDAWLARMRDAGVPVVDLRPALVEVKQRHGEAFYRSDTHWNIEGAKAAAFATAHAVRQLGFSPVAPLQITHEASEPRPRWGDLVRLAGLDGLPERLRPAPDLVPILSFTAEPSDPASLSADALFGDAPDARVALVGTSFSRNAYFSDFLSQAMATTIGNMAKDGGGFALSMDDFLRQEEGQASPTPWVIWEITERALHEPLQDVDHDLAKGVMYGAV
jgi:alginate O-acetyltransferase complex protein AlgJ